MLKNPRQEKFCNEYLKLGNATQATINAGFSEKSADTQGARLLSNPIIAARLAELREDAARSSELSILEQIKLLEENLRFHPKEVFGNQGDLLVVKPVEEWSDVARRMISIKTSGRGGKQEFIYDPRKYHESLDSLIRILGGYSEFNQAFGCLVKYGINLKQGADGKWFVEGQTMH